MKPSAQVRETRNVLFEQGWIQDRARSADGVCLGYAMISLSCGELALKAVIEAAGTDDLVAFNDEWDRTFDDIVDVLDRAEKIAEQQELAV